MKDRKLQVFVSSTFIDLKEERQAAVEAILSSGHIPAGMELFAAGDQSQMSVIERWIDESDVYLLILGGRYGSIDKKTNKSYTQLEYEYALQKGKPMFAVVISDKAINDKIIISGPSVIEQENNRELRLFRAVVESYLVKFWDDKKDIKIAIHETLSDFSYRKDLIGWIRGNNLVNTAFLAEEIAKLTNENSELRNRLNTEANNSSLYAGLTYDELTVLLERREYILDEEEENLFVYLLIRGDLFLKGYHDEKEIDFLEALEIFKIIRQIWSAKDRSNRYLFTDEGHNYYLKAQLLNPDF